MENKKSDLYTKTGDRGTTSLTGGQRIKKSSLRLDCYGSVDELNSYLGLLASRSLRNSELALLTSIQNTLFVIGAYLATNQEDKEFKAQYTLSEQHIKSLEEAIDKFDNEVPSMTGFILPRGGATASIAHIARTICRRVERLLFTFDEKEEKVDKYILIYFNRLSDLLFVLARVIAHREGEEEILWTKGK